MHVITVFLITKCWYAYVYFAGPLGVDNIFTQLSVFIGDTFALLGANDWARKSLELHRNDKREYVYTLEQLECAQTHDKLWNAAQVSG